MSSKIKELTGDVETLRSRINDLEVERTRDKIEKEKILKESSVLSKQLEAERKDKKKVENERDLTQRMLSDYRKIIEGLEKRITALEDKTKQKDHELSKAYGTISTLTNQLSKLTDKTQPIPDLSDEPEPDKPIKVEIVDPPNAVTPADVPADNKPDNEDTNEDKIA